MTIDQAVQNYLSQGYTIVGTYGKNVQMRKPKGNPSCLALIILFLLGIIPGILYLIWFSVKPEETITLTSDEAGNYIEPIVPVQEPGKPLSKGAIIAIVVVVIIVIIICVASMSSQGNVPVGLLLR